jgi:hypothetical protein
LPVRYVNRRAQRSDHCVSLTYVSYSCACVIDLSRIRFSDHETMAPSRGWSGCFHTFTVFYPLQPRLGTIVSWPLKRIRERYYRRTLNNRKCIVFTYSIKSDYLRGSLCKNGPLLFASENSFPSNFHHKRVFTSK